MNTHIPAGPAIPTQEVAAEDGRGAHTLREILTQPDAWRDALYAVEAQRNALRTLWQNGSFSDVLVTGCGSTYYLSQIAAPLIQQQLRIRARALPGSELLLFPDAVTPPDGTPLLLTISRSGRTSETIRAARAFTARHQAPMLTIGCYPDTELVAQSDLALVAPEGQEESVVQTRSFSAMTVMAQAAVAALHGDERLHAMQTLPALGERLIAEQHNLARELGSSRTFERFYFLGSGLHYGLASEANLKMKEMSLSVAEAFHFLEFRHGPMSMVNDQTLVVGLVSESARSFEIAVLREMRALGAKTLVLSEQPVPADAADYQVTFDSGLPEASRLVLYLPVLQLLGFYRSITNGLDPDQPHNLTAVVELGPDA